MEKNLRPGTPTLDKILDFIAETRWVWALGIVITCILFLSGILEIPNFSFSGNLKTIIVISIFSGILSIVPAKKLVESFYTPEYEFIFSINAERDDPIELYAVGSDIIDQIETFPGHKSMYSMRGSGGFIKNYLREFDAENLEGKINWHGMEEEIDLLRTQEKIKDIRIDRRKTMQKALKIYTSLDSILEDIASKFYQKESFKVSDATDKIDSEMEEFLEDSLSMESENSPNTAEELLEEIDSDNIEDNRSNE